MMGPNSLPDLSTLYKLVPNPTLAAGVKAYCNALLSASAGLRAVSALAANSVEFNRDDYGGFNYERKQLISMFKRSAKNAIVWGGDLHDSFAWVLYEGLANQTGNAVAVNIGGPAVTSAGLAPLLLPALV